MQNSELRAKNIIVTGLKESAECLDNDLAMELFSTQFGRQPNISYCRRLRKHELTDDRKVRSLFTAFDSPHTAQDFIMNAKVLLSEVVREHVYINRDLTKAQSQGAYELRCRRRAALLVQRLAVNSITELHLQQLQQPQRQPQPQRLESYDLRMLVIVCQLRLGLILTPQLQLSSHQAVLLMVLIIDYSQPPITVWFQLCI